MKIVNASGDCYHCATREQALVFVHIRRLLGYGSTLAGGWQGENKLCVDTLKAIHYAFFLFFDFITVINKINTPIIITGKIKTQWGLVFIL